MGTKKENSDLLGTLFWYSFALRSKFVSIFNQLIRLYCLFRGVKFENKVHFLGFPVIRRHPYSEIFIGNNCRLNSSKNSVLQGLINPCKLITLKKNAEIILGQNVGISGTIIVAASRIKIGNNVMVGAHCTIFDTDFHNPDPKIRLNNEIIPSRPITIEDNVFLGYNCLVLKGVTIGENAVIGANSVVINNIPKNSIALGNPCKVIIRKNW